MHKRWTIDGEDGAHTVEVNNSYWTSIQTITVDGVLVAKGRKNVRIQPFDTLFELRGHACAIRTIPSFFTYSFDLIVDGRSIATGEVAESPGPFPKWAWLFIIACCAITFVGGLIGGLIGGVGAATCVRIARDHEIGGLLSPVLCGIVTMITWFSFMMVSIALINGDFLPGH